MTKDMAVRLCESSYSCAGNYESCAVNNKTADMDTTLICSITSEEEDSLSKPTKEAYEKAKKDKEYIATCLNLSRKRRNELIDELCKERESEKFYMQMYERHRDIVRRYELYEEIGRNE